MDLTSPKTIKNIQSKFGFTFKKGLGQNFLTSSAVLDDITDAAEIDGGVIEIGPGFGVLTQRLSEAADKVVSVEIDERLIDVLEYTLADCGNVKIIHGDVLKLDLHKLIAEEFPEQKISIAANLPYYITTPIITRLLEERLPINNIVVMVQKEVAERLQARPGTKDYGTITVMCRYYTEPEIITIVPSGLFVPPPKVDSAVLRLRLLDKPRVDVKDEKIFFRTVKSAFLQRRKTLLNCLASSFGLSKTELTQIMEAVGIEPSRRGETLDINEFAALSDGLTERIK
ncbi:MAG: 16S rRNA (adenine(1518)-N(6)/adenine(1519)-N(6))-dimethyltransferase RsmA [Oscillospiraceae bacterium]|nr:16S rRNA (adenine(1518)-N(6)/adenine(1519)-N(6))-dimethyltransferase RsmA [Oscillospiraceae bacterium]